MVEPLRKRGKDGKPYERRPAIEKELQELETLALPDIVAHARAGEQIGKPSVSSEALVHTLRREVRLARPDGPTLGAVDALAAMLIARCEKILKRRLWRYDDLAREEIAGDVTNRVVDEIYEDGDKADYAEVNFNDWLAHNRVDAVRKYERKAARTERLGDSVEDLRDGEAQIVAEDESTDASHENTPEASYALKEARERANLPSFIEQVQFSPDELHRIAEVVKKAKLPANVLNAFLAYHALGRQIESEDPNEHTLVKHFNKSEKTIRIWIKRAEKVFAELREMKNESKGNDEDEPGIRTARLSH